jgi:hypothetical protein
MKFRVLALIASIGVLAGCGGGGSHAVPSPASSSSGSGSTGAQGTARFTLTIPNQGVQVAAKGRAPQYVSASTLSASITATPGNITTNIDLGVASPLCTTVVGGRACTLPVAAQIGSSDHFSMVLYSGACTGGPPCTPSGTPLSAASNFGPIAVTEGQTNVTAPLILGGIPATVDVSAAGFTSGTAATQTLTVTAYDASGNVIVGPAAYVDATGAAAPLNVALGIVPYNNQVTLHDGAQNNTTISVAGPSDATTVQLSSPANVIGIPFVVENTAQHVLAAHTTQMVAVSGALTATLLATNVGGQPDYTLYAPMNVNSATGMVDGFVFDFGTASNGGQIGFFNSDALPQENFNYCNVPGAQADVGVSPIDGGVAFAYAAGLSADTNPWGINWLPRGDFTSIACPAGTPFETDTLSTPDSVARSMAYDPVAHKLFTGGDSSFVQPSGPTVNPSLRYDSFSGAAFSANTILSNNLASSPTSMIDYRGSRYYLLGNSGTNVYAQTGVSAPLTMSIGGTNLSNIVSGYDGRVYALDLASQIVFAWDGTSPPVRYTAGAFTFVPNGQPWQLAIGPDGTAFAGNGLRTVESLPASGAPTSVTIPTISGSGRVDAVFDGTNGYVYAAIEDFSNGTMNVVRISR